MRVLLLSRAALVASYRSKLEAIAAQPDVDLTVVVPPSWNEPGRVQRLEPGPTPGYRLVTEPIARNGAFHTHWYPRLGTRIAGLQPDVVHIEEEPYNVATALATRAASRRGARVVVFTWQNIARRYPPPFATLERATLARTDHLVCGTNAALDVWRAKGYRGPASVLPQVGVDPAIFRPLDARPASRPFTIGYVGRLVPAKGVDVLVRAFAAAFAAGDTPAGARLALIGDGPARHDLELLADRLGIAHRLDVTGWTPSHEVAARIQSLDVLVMPSRTTPAWKEQFGRALVEAMACGVAVVGSDSGEIPRVIGDAGLVFPEGDAHALGSILGSLARDPARVAELGRRGRARATQEYTNAAIAARTVQIYRTAGRKGPRITIVAHEVHDHGGMEAAMANLVRRAAADYDLTVVAADVDPALREIVRWRRVPTPAAPLALRLATFAALAAPMVRTSRSRLVHTLGAIVPNRADLATVQYCHATAPSDARDATTSRVRRWNHRIAHGCSLAAERWCYRPARLRRFAAVSRGVADEVTSAYGGIPVTITPNGVDLERFAPDPVVRAEVRRTYGVADDEVVALFVGGDWERKGLALAIDAVGRVARTGAAIRLWVVGRGDVDRYQRVANEAGIGDRVTFHGFRPDRERFFLGADVFTLPSRYETFCIAAFEAAAAALPLVMTAVNDVGAIVHDGAGGVLVDADAATLAEAIAVFAADPARRVAEGAVARARSSAYTWDASVASVLALYAELLGSTSNERTGP